MQFNKSIVLKILHLHAFKLCFQYAYNVKMINICGPLRRNESKVAMGLSVQMVKKCQESNFRVNFFKVNFDSLMFHLLFLKISDQNVE